MRATPVAVDSISFTITRTAKSKINNYSFLSFIMGTNKNLNKFYYRDLFYNKNIIKLFYYIKFINFNNSFKKKKKKKLIKR